MAVQYREDIIPKKMYDKAQEKYVSPEPKRSLRNQEKGS